MMTDPIADLLTRIRNAVRLNRDAVVSPSSKVKVAICDALQREGYIRGYEVDEDTKPRPTLHIFLKYGEHGEEVIGTIRRVSKPGCRVYCGCDGLPRPLSGLGVLIVSTNRGIRSDRECRRERLGGEILCELT